MRTGAPGEGRSLTEQLGRAFAEAVAAKDTAVITSLLHPELDFQAMTPRRTWDAATPADVVQVLHTWFGDGDAIEELVALESDSFADRARVGYRLLVRNADGPHLVEQQAYLTERDGQISWLRIMCAGYRPV